MSQIASDPSTAEKIAASLLKIQAVKLDINHPFTWSSGWKSPIYCDNRLALGYPEIRGQIRDHLVAKIKDEFPECQAIAGVATAGIPHAALVADAMGLPFLYVRSKAKGHGLENLIEGRIVAEQKIVVIEDLISTAGSSLRAIEALKAANFQVLGLAAIFSYGFEVARQSLEQSAVKWFSLSSYSYLIDHAAELGLVDETQVQSLQAWREQPQDWEPFSAAP